MILAYKDNEVLLSWILDRLLQGPVSHILLTESEGWDLLLAHELDGSVREGLHHLAGKERCAFHTTLLRILDDPGRRFKQRPVFDLCMQLLSGDRVDEPDKTRGDLLGR